jgi:hypothetical protein
MEDAFGILPSWLITPGTTIPKHRLHINHSNALWMMQQEDPSHARQGAEYLNGVRSLINNQNEHERHYMELERAQNAFDEEYAHMETMK